LDYCALDIFLCTTADVLADSEIGKLFQADHVKSVRLLRGRGSEIQDRDWVLARSTPAYRELYRASETLAEETTAFQALNIFSSPEFGKILVLDGDVQIAQRDEQVYHEHLVHPALLAHGSPEDVAIIGGGDGGSLRQVLKHPSVKRVVLVDIDRVVVERCRELMPEVNRGSYEDPRVKILYQDAAEYLEQAAHDVVIVDLTAPVGPSIPAYRALLKNIGKSSGRGSVIAYHSGWWGSQQLVDFPRLLSEMFQHQLVYNRWIDSFSCFWSFVTAWNGEESEGDILERVVEKSSTVPTISFDAREYANQVLMKVHIA
jgi:spermidine synthase